MQEDIFVVLNVHEPDTCMKNESFSSVLEE